MTSRIIQLHLDLLNNLTAIPKVGDSSKRMFKYINLWNEEHDDSIKNKKENGDYAFNFPAIFIEFIPGDCKMLGAGMSSYPDSKVKLHIFSMKLNSGDKMEQNLDVFTLRDVVKAKMVGLGITACSSLMCCYDKLDYVHGNVYKYILEFVTNFMDSKGSYFDPDSGSSWATLQNPTLTIPQFQMFGVDVYYNSTTNSYYVNQQ